MILGRCDGSCWDARRDASIDGGTGTVDRSPRPRLSSSGVTGAVISLGKTASKIEIGGSTYALAATVAAAAASSDVVLRRRVLLRRSGTWRYMAWGAVPPGP